ncbi:putative rmlC-like cupin domain superfamily, rmlC-like jelly roll protein [Helianthus debilis subsp. tardiflorus]
MPCKLQLVSIFPDITTLCVHPLATLHHLIYNPTPLSLHATNQPNMAKLFVSLSFLLLIHACLAFQPSFQQQNQCQIQRLNALEPIERVQSEAGFTEFFNSNEQEFQCAGVEVIRHQIQPQGLLLPSYTNTPILFFVEQGTLH